MVILLLTGTVCSALAQATCPPSVVVPGSAARVSTLNVAVRLSDSERRGYYSRVLSDRFDEVYFAKGIKADRSGVRLSSLYTYMVQDPANFRYFLSTGAQYRRAVELREQLFGSATPGVQREVPSAVSVAPVRDYWTDDKIRDVAEGEWLSDFIGFALNAGLEGPLTELWSLQQNSGDATSSVMAEERSRLFDLDSSGFRWSVTFVLRTGAVEIVEVASIEAGLFQMQLRKPALCSAFLEAKRLWFYQPFVDRYAQSFRTGSVHLYGQVKPWAHGSSVGLVDQSVFDFVKQGLMVSGVIVSVKSDTFVLDQLVLSPIAPSLMELP